jgi:hypothetical protein
MRTHILPGLNEILDYARDQMTTASWKEKTFGTAFAVGLTAFWSVLMIALFWETTSLQCQPIQATVPVTVQCTLINEQFPGSQRLFRIAKSDIMTVKLVRQDSKKKYPRVILVQADGQEIPFTRGWNTDATMQLEPRLPEINAFLADPRARTLDVSTQRRFPLLSLLLTLGVLAFNGVMLKRIWFGFTPKSAAVDRRLQRQ